MSDIEQRLAALEARVLRLEGGTKAATPAASTDTRVDLDSEHGDPVVRKDPKRWKGPSYEGRRYSECPPDYLEVLASLLDWKAGKNEEDGKEKYAGYDRLDAARARGWAKRKADGWSPTARAARATSPKPQPASEQGDAFQGEYDQEIPF